MDEVVDRGLPYARMDISRLGRAETILDGCRILELMSWTRRGRTRTFTEDAVLVKVGSLRFPIRPLVCGPRFSMGRLVRSRARST